MNEQKRTDTKLNTKGWWDNLQGFLESLQGKIVALTSVVVALGALWAAIQVFIPKHGSNSPPAVTTTTPLPSHPAAIATPSPTASVANAMATPVATPIPIPEQTDRFARNVAWSNVLEKAQWLAPSFVPWKERSQIGNLEDLSYALRDFRSKFSPLDDDIEESVSNLEGSIGRMYTALQRLYLGKENGYLRQAEYERVSAIKLILNVSSSFGFQHTEFPPYDPARL